eukprot:scaffold2232_cov136-Skeletonema_menzelii.AAC.3
MTATPCQVIKRKRTSSSSSGLPCQNIRDLAFEPLRHVASFLPTPSRALFAIALSTDWAYADWGDEENLPSMVWWLEQIAGKCDNLDFGDIEEDLARRLTDNHIDEILLCLDRDDNRIKKLRLTNCTNVTGVCLQRLRGSSTIEQIDLSMVPDHDRSTSGVAPKDGSNSVMWWEF